AALSSGQAELGFVLHPPSDATFSRRKVASYRYRVALPKKAVTNSRSRRIALQDLNGLNWITIPDKFRPGPSCTLPAQMETFGFSRERRVNVGSL
ncbi:LysR substrate-binding domain-containing protein, partial [Acinetobacter baumannii]